MKRSAKLALAALTISGAYLYTFPAANIPYLTIDLAHILLGLVFALVLFLWLPRLRTAPSSTTLGWITLAIGTALGIAADIHRRDAALLLHCCIAIFSFARSRWSSRDGLLCTPHVTAIRGISRSSWWQ
jgi:uncharacterized membrane protein